LVDTGQRKFKEIDFNRLRGGSCLVAAILLPMIAPPGGSILLAGNVQWASASFEDLVLVS